MKIALGIEYDGSGYLGWQKQNAAPTIQETLETALSEIADERISVTCAGRTDKGVHAVQQVVHFETSVIRPVYAWILGSNTKLPGDIAVTWAKNMSNDFHARFSAVKRTYQYVILNRRSRPAIFNKRVTWKCRELDLDRIKSATEIFIGEHDFTSLRSAHCQAKSAVREVFSLEVNRISAYIVITISANAFLHHMVRNIAGVLMSIGEGMESVKWAEEVLSAKDRTVGGVTAPPDGLYLADISYPEHFAIPAGETLTQSIKLY